MGRKHSTGDSPGQQVITDDGTLATASPTTAKAPPLTARQRFQKHAERRVSNLLKALKHVKALANRKSYEFTEDEQAAMLSVIDTAYKSMRAEFLEPKTADRSGGFRFSGWGTGGNGTATS